jgi:hypothetical protein
MNKKNIFFQEKKNIMEKDSILKISGKNIQEKNISEIKNFLKNKYEYSYGDYSPRELKKALSDKLPFFIQDHFIIGYDPRDNHFISDRKEKIDIGRMVKAVIVEAERDCDDENDGPDIPCDNRDVFIIMGQNEWEEDCVSRMQSIMGNLHVGEIFLPPHSAIVNFLTQTEEQRRKKIVSMLSGDNINIYSPENFIDNIMHETGHLFWRDCVKPEEQVKFKDLFKILRPSAIFEYEWERTSPEEVFCTVYKWYLKSLLLNSSFKNILQYEEPAGLKLLEDVFDRKRRDKLAADTWRLSSDDLFNYLNPKFDITTGKKIIRKGIFDEIKGIDIPEEVQAENMDRYEHGRRMVRFGKAVVPVLNGRIDWAEMEDMRKARMTKYIRREPDGKGSYRYWYTETNQNVKKSPK